MKKIDPPKNDLTQKEAGSEYKVPNLDRGLSVLAYLSNYPDGLTMSEISRALEIPKNSAHRILMTMWARGFLNRHERNKKFILTQKLLAIGSCVITEKHLTEEAIDIMRDLRDLVEETVLLNTRMDDHSLAFSLRFLPARGNADSSISLHFFPIKR